MKIANNNLAFRSSPVQQNLELVASMKDEDIKKASKQMAYRDYAKREKNTQKLALGVIFGLPFVDGILAAAAQPGRMASRIKAGAKVFGSYSAYAAIGLSFIGLANKVAKDSPSINKFRKENPATYVVGILAGMIATTAGTITLLKGPIKTLINKLDKGAKVRQAVGGQLNRLEGGHLESGLNKINKTLNKEVKTAKYGSIIGTGISVGILALFANHLLNLSKVNKDAKQHENQLRDLRSQSREILDMKNEAKTIDEEAETTKELLNIEIQECEDSQEKEQIES